MYCNQCGANNEDLAVHCTKCGALIRQLGTTLSPGPNLANVPAGMLQAPTRTVPNYMVQSVLLTLFCCMPLGAVCFFMALQINKRLATNDYEGALKASKTSRTLLWIGFAVGFVLSIILAIATFISTVKGS
jgi:uncharacterized membrane protein YvbJ